MHASRIDTDDSGDEIIEKSEGSMVIELPKHEASFIPQQQTGVGDYKSE